MTTFEHGNAPAWACATWIYVNGPKEGVKIHSCYSDPIYAHVDRADRLCRALSTLLLLLRLALIDHSTQLLLTEAGGISSCRRCNSSFAPVFPRQRALRKTELLWVRTESSLSFLRGEQVPAQTQLLVI